MSEKFRVKDLLCSDQTRSDINLMAWVRTRRDSKEFSFIELNDGSCLTNIQVIADQDTDGYEKIDTMSVGASINLSGDLIESPGKGQKWEIKAKKLRLVGVAPEDYPLQKKRHSDEFLRTIAHLRPRTNKYGAMFRIRSSLSQAIHQFFSKRGFLWIHTPIITGSDCEGAGELFLVTTIEPGNVSQNNGVVDYTKDFFGKEAYLSVSGQLSVETCCLALGNVYTFGPTFRSENSNTSRHMAEFWMIEPELAFADLDDDMDLGEEFIRYLVNHVVNNCAEDLHLFSSFVNKNLSKTLEIISNKQFIRIPYSDSIDILKKSNQDFEFTPEWGKDLQSEHEQFLTEKHFNQPIIVYNYPKIIKPFYMRQNDDEKTVAAMDILVPSIGEIIGGSQREEKFNYLLNRIQELGSNTDEYWWYLDTRKYGTVPHAGFGLGLERLLMLVTGTSNIRDVIPFPRTPKHLDF